MTKADCLRLHPVLDADVADVTISPALVWGLILDEVADMITLPDGVGLSRRIPDPALLAPRFSDGVLSYRDERVEVRGSICDYDLIADHVAVLALTCAIGNNTEVSTTLSYQIMPIVAELLRAIEEGDALYLREIAKRCQEGRLLPAMRFSVYGLSSHGEPQASIA